MTNTYQNFLALRRMVFGHLRLLAIFVGVTFIVDHWRSSGGHDAAQGYANGQVAYLSSGGPAFVPLSPATLLNKMHKDASFDVGDAVSAIVQSFDDSKRGQVLESYLIWAISTERSDSYIDTLLNSAAAKGDFKVPPALTTASGALDTAGLLTAVVVAERKALAARQTDGDQAHARDGQQIRQSVAFYHNQAAPLYLAAVDLQRDGYAPGRRRN
ncbi:hypothetical protein [uncultured Sulfitobacter sp.]|jgi:hypothetical protein|uniref:hypothetical protein n=1 Tax=uncultured Sulfitobacter sp. TaxID=191468 RepID=UPI0025935CE4|nr:hypothetical protein [uncultured Sulfitobacter sp.]